jgi:hypothetical protein
MQVIPTGRKFVTIADDPLAHFLNRYNKNSRAPAKRAVVQFLDWLNEHEGWRGVGPKELLIRQLQAGDPYEIPELIQTFANARPNLRNSTILKRIGLILKFFEWNRSPLPRDVTPNWFKVQSTVPPVQNQLTAEVIRAVILGLSSRWRSLFLVEYQAMLDTPGLCWLNNNGAAQITRQLREGRKIIRIDLPQCVRKQVCRRESTVPFFTYFGRDAATALTSYFNEERDWPESGQPIWVYTREDLKRGRNRYSRDTRGVGDGLQDRYIWNRWRRALRTLNYIPRKSGTLGTRYGYNLLQFRAVAVSELYAHAKDQGLDLDCVKFWCGQIWEIDPSHLEYDKFYNNSDYMEKQYAIAEPYLNIISGTPQEREAQAPAHENPPSHTMTYTVSTTTTF